MEEIDWFFQSPCMAPQPDAPLSQLYLLRRDVDMCFGIDPNTGEILQGVPFLALLPGTMAILAGIDLLGKLHSGSESRQGVGNRFKSFVVAYLNLSQADAALLYALRNSLLHSFGLYWQETNKRGEVVAEYKFNLSRNGSRLIGDRGDGRCTANIELLRQGFEQGIASYHKDLDADIPGLRSAFMAVYPNHVSPVFVQSRRA